MPATTETGNHAVSADPLRGAMLDWYDRHRRALPWRALPGTQSDPYRVWLSEIMLQQTTVGAVAPYFLKFIARWPTVRDLADAREEDVMDAWAGLGYYSRARNLHRCAKLVADELGCRFPKSVEALKALPGVGDYTAAAIASIAYDLPATVIDGNIERVIARVFAITTPLPEAKKEIRRCAGILSADRADRPGDYAQAMMDLGATICTPRSPRCMFCPIAPLCAARAIGIQDTLPRKAAKSEKPRRAGLAYWIEDGNGNVLLERRRAKTLLGNMIGLPGSDWCPEEDPGPLQHPPLVGAIESYNTDRHVRHVFTHFELRLTPVRATLSNGVPEGYFWHPVIEIDQIGMPTLFRKVALLAREG